MLIAPYTLDNRGHVVTQHSLSQGLSMIYLKAIGFGVLVNVCVLLAVLSTLTLLAILGTVASQGITIGWALVAMCVLSAVTWFYLACSLISSGRTR